MRERYERMHATSVELLADVQFHGALDVERDVDAEATRHMAGWDGLQLLSQYLPGRVDVVERLSEREALWSLPYGWREPDDTGPLSDVPAGPLPASFGWDPVEDDGGYAVGRLRRIRIVADAMRLFAQDGYGNTSLRDIAAAVGVSKSTLLHHYPTKELLLSAVLAERDRAIRSRNGAPMATGRAADALRSIVEGARVNAVVEPGLIEVYAVLSCEAVPDTHPAHDYFARRFDLAVTYFTDMFRLAQLDGDLPEHLDPEHEAIWLIALWDGLQYQWLYDRDAIDVADHLQAHLDDILPGR